MIRPPSYVSEIKPYVPGKPIEELERELGITDSVKLASNENPIGPSVKAIKVLLEGIMRQDVSSGINRYPDGSGYYLKKAISEKLSVGEDEIILGNGSNELIDIAVRTFIQPGDEVIMGNPSFVVYFSSVHAQGAKAVQVPLKNYTHDLDAMADAITSKTKMLFIANPNNPTGTINKKEEMSRMMERIPDGVLIVADEAYIEYVTDPEYAESMKYLKDGRDVLILRTFSKIYGLAGLRIGYAIAPKYIITEMNKLRPPFNTSTLAQKAALAAIQDDEHIQASRAVNENGKQYLYEELDKLGIKYIPTQANFIYMILEQNSAEIYENLLREGVIVRPVGQKEIRVTIGLTEENKRFIESLSKFINKK